MNVTLIHLLIFLVTTGSSLGKFSEYGWDKLPVNNITIATNEVASYYKTVALPSKKNNTSINCKIPVFNGELLKRLSVHL